MGGAVSSGRDNDELVDNLISENFLRSAPVKRVFRALDRADYMKAEAWCHAYKDVSWRSGRLHISAPCIYSVVMEGLELRPGLSFLNVGSGTGYLSTMVGLILGSSGISHGVELFPCVVDYANAKLEKFLEHSPLLDEFDFCLPKFYLGNGLCLAPLQTGYDRVYCGASCPEEFLDYFKQLIRVGGILIAPVNDSLLQVRRVSQREWRQQSLLSVSFAALKVPTGKEAADIVKLEEQSPARLAELSRSEVRRCVRRSVLSARPELCAAEPDPSRARPASRPAPRRICIPIDDDDSERDEVNLLHDLDERSGAREMNALLSLVLSLEQAGVVAVHSDTDADTDAEAEDDEQDEQNDAPLEDGLFRRARWSPPPLRGLGIHWTQAQRNLRRSLRRRQSRRRQPASRSDNDSPPGEAEDEAPSRSPPTALPRSSTVLPRSHPAVPSRSPPAVPSRFNRNKRTNSRRSGIAAIPTPTVIDRVYLPDLHLMEGVSSSDSDAAPAASGSEKRQKLDSGLGDEPLTGDDTPPSDQPRDDVDSNDDEAWQRSLLGALDSTSGEEGESEGEECIAPSQPSRRPAPSRRCRRPAALKRRTALSAQMRSAVLSLPLPHPLKIYVNLNRSFEVC